MTHRTRGGSRGRSPGRARALLLLPAGVAMLSGLDAALMLLGLPAPVRLDRLPEVHGVLMVLGFLGTVISLERAVALGRRLGYLAPATLGAGALLLVSPAPLVAGRAALVLGTAALVAVYRPLWLRQRDEAVLVQALGAVLACGAAVLWFGGAPVPTLLPWLVGFVVLTIGGERLELARLAMGPEAGARLLLLSAGLVGAVVGSAILPAPGAVAVGVCLLVLAGWLARHDVARHTVRGQGAVRFAAASMLAAYAWLGVAATTWALGGRVVEGARYDAVIHAVFLGFAMSMVMGHAPTILPAVVRRPLPHHPAMGVAATVLHLSLVLRLWGGDALGQAAMWTLGGVLNIVGLLGFVAVAAWSATRAGHRTRTTAVRRAAEAAA